MAAANSSLSIEFECSVCSDQLNQPKYIGPCNHTFCKDCIDKYWVSLGRRGTIPCPECRQECPIPQNGADDLKDNFKLSNIMETYRNQQQRTAYPTEVKCNGCANGAASSLCEECDLKLCPRCKEQHDSHHSTSAHEFFGLCPTHGNGLLFFCSPCKQAVCSRCRISDHDQGDHHVIPIRPVVDHLVSRIQASSAELEDAIGTHVEERENQMSQLRDIVQQKSTSAEVQATADTDKNINAKRKEMRGLTEDSQSIQEQINALVKKRENVDSRTEQLVKDVDQLENEKKRIIEDVRERIAKSSEEINLRLLSLETRRKEMTTKLEQGRAVGSTKINIDTESIAYLTSISQELMHLVSALKTNDTETVIEEVMRSFSELGLYIVDMGQGLIVICGDHQIRIVKTERVFRQLKKVCNVTSPRDRTCKVVYRLKHLHRPDSRLATLGGPHAGHVGVDRIYFHDEVSSSLTGTITEGVQPARDMAVLSTGEVVVARQKQPPLRVFNPGNGAYRDINIILDGKVIDKLRYVETDESDNMFVLTGSTINPLLVVKPNGSFIQSVQFGDYVYGMAFCSLNRILYIAAHHDRILRFHWRNNILKEIPSSSNGVERFNCHDVCIGGGGEVLVAGVMENKSSIVIHQLINGEDEEEELVWRKIEYQDGVKRKNRSWFPRICISDDNLWLGNDDKIEKLRFS